jgi:hypothetical protein
MVTSNQKTDEEKRDLQQLPMPPIAYVLLALPTTSNAYVCTEYMIISSKTWILLPVMFTKFWEEGIVSPHLPPHARGSVETSIESFVKVSITVTWWRGWQHDTIVLLLVTLWKFPIRSPSYATLKNWQRISFPKFRPRTALLAEKEATVKEKNTDCTRSCREDAFAEKRRKW